MTHTDGENRVLLPLYQEAGFDRRRLGLPISHDALPA